MLQQGSYLSIQIETKGHHMRRLEPTGSPLWLHESSTLTRDDSVHLPVEHPSEIRRLEFASMRHRSQVCD
jgi:hypothetical protein